MNIKTILNGCMLAAMVTAFFISNGITRLKAQDFSSCSSQGDGTCKNNGCNGGNNDGTYADCCFSAGSECVCSGVLIGNC